MLATLSTMETALFAQYKLLTVNIAQIVHIVSFATVHLLRMFQTLA